MPISWYRCPTSEPSAWVSKRWKLLSEPSALAEKPCCFSLFFEKNDETWRSRPFKAFLGALMEDKKWRGFIVIHLGPIVPLRTWQWHTVTVNYGDQSTKEHSIFILDYIITRYQRTRTCRDCRDETATIGINKKQVGDWPTQIWRWTSWPLFGGGGLTHKIYLHGT